MSIDKISAVVHFLTKHVTPTELATACKTTKKGKQERKGKIPEGTIQEQEMVMTTKWGITYNNILMIMKRLPLLPGFCPFFSRI